MREGGRTEKTREATPKTLITLPIYCIYWAVLSAGELREDKRVVFTIFILVEN